MSQARVIGTFGRPNAKKVFRDLYAVWGAMGETGDFVFESNAGFEPALAPFVGDPGGGAEPDYDAVRKLAGHPQVGYAEVRRFLQHFCCARRCRSGPRCGI